MYLSGGISRLGVRVTCVAAAGTDRSLKNFRMVSVFYIVDNYDACNRVALSVPCRHTPSRLNSEHFPRFLFSLKFGWRGGQILYLRNTGATNLA